MNEILIFRGRPGEGPRGGRNVAPKYMLPSICIHDLPHFRRRDACRACRFVRLSVGAFIHSLIHQMGEFVGVFFGDVFRQTAEHHPPHRAARPETDCVNCNSPTLLCERPRVPCLLLITRKGLVE